MSIFHDVKKLLVVIAHPDDEVLGAGGTIARLCAMKKDVRTLILGGVTTSRGELTGKKIGQLSAEAENAQKVLGVKRLYRSDIEDNRFDSIPLIDIIRKVEEVKASFRPDMVITHDHCDLNIDHRLTHQDVMTAFRPASSHNRTGIMTCEILSSTEWQDQEVMCFRPNLYVDISKFMDKKLRAMKCYKSELNDFPHPRSLKGIEVLAAKRGMEVSFRAAEAFRLVRGIA